MSSLQRLFTPAAKSPEALRSRTDSGDDGDGSGESLSDSEAQAVADATPRDRQIDKLTDIVGKLAADIAELKASSTGAATGKSQRDQRFKTNDLAEAVGHISKVPATGTRASKPKEKSFKTMLREGIETFANSPKQRGRGQTSPDVSDSSSVSDASSNSRRKTRRRRDKHDQSADKPMGPAILAKALKFHRSVLEYVLSLEFKNQRSFHECRRIAQAVDAFLAAGIDAKFLGMEHLLRNLAGLQIADQYKDPALLEELEWDPPQDIVPKSVLRTVIKDAERRKKYLSPSPAPSDPKGGAGAGGR